MSQPDPSARPSQVTLAGWAIAGASVLLVLAVFNTMGQLDSVDMRERLSEAISSGWVKGLGISLGDATDLVRWSLYVTGVAAAASSILGVFVLQGHRGARIGVTVSAALVLTASIASVLTGILALALVVFAALLWSGPGGDWFAGRPITVRPRPERRPQSQEPRPPSAPVAWAPPTPGSAQPPPTPGWGQVAPPSATDWPAPTSWPAPIAAPATAPAPDSAGLRPSQVRLACILTWIFSSVVAVGYAFVFVVLLVNKPWVAQEIQKSPGWNDSFDVDTVTSVATGASIVFVIWSAGAIALALLVWRRVRWAWILLLVSTWVAGFVSVLGFPFSLPYVAVIGATAGLLMRRPVRDWFAETPYAGPRSPFQAPPSDPQQRPPVW
ncbi:hypothetical protein [Nocardioides marmorisolisilvae]|uniref:DUF4064 domain-containing protein n=1 Tax=Nocardioides marmorisolisilvae TaxID=1542737 RepID=A0A3N0E0C2_9ACTN|nr:hypothetical protein [Nocardioides marmorisolisilvae]RNL81294.1 hypothetical protein EFL95_02745 [Nocardioides marmorisolisilvae]